MAKLKELKVKNAKAGTYSDGAGLLLRVKQSGAKSWVLRVQHMGRRSDIGLGGYPADLTLAEAREKAARLRKIARAGADPRAERDRAKVHTPTFAEAMAAAHLALSKGWSPRTAEAFKASSNTSCRGASDGRRDGAGTQGQHDDRAGIFALRSARHAAGADGCVGPVRGAFAFFSRRERGRTGLSRGRPLTRRRHELEQAGASAAKPSGNPEIASNLLPPGVGHG